ncbi:hypothetical protein ACIPVK_00815 [Paeniglutamicibacter sp. MACA_103]|uniref:hypothetical protein n=1 Tax=Paeniglutamicibacter sp. MACA_103 TaxID=3377337 RepID=UPI00389593A5
MHQLDLIRAAAEDVASARILLNERIEALNAIVATALDHDVPATDVAEAAHAAQLPGTEGFPLAANRLLPA